MPYDNKPIEARLWTLVRRLRWVQRIHVHADQLHALGIEIVPIPRGPIAREIAAAELGGHAAGRSRRSMPLLFHFFHFSTCSTFLTFPFISRLRGEPIVFDGDPHRKVIEALPLHARQPGGLVHGVIVEATDPG